MEFSLRYLLKSLWIVIKAIDKPYLHDFKIALFLDIEL